MNSFDFEREKKLWVPTAWNFGPLHLGRVAKACLTVRDGGVYD